ncbi:uncharacterized protein L3040_001415 [Drepanopeziza brunnea f. sp. 'multigermtubi']|uniref:uncharacterized protein n=1 Tax=Drepanopeziza brunnea f. sp. 'multigermtubi' TaxID=698441 RepID=UPI00238D073C|nr:hypothetical protein L3040_001415 [Drepanopeziza brunnea f. sp. 'multigermtubi']
MQFTAILSILALSAGVVHAGVRAGQPAYCSGGTSYPNVNCLGEYQFCCSELQTPDTPTYRGDCITYTPSVDCTGGTVRCCVS